MVIHCVFLLGYRTFYRVDVANAAYISEINAAYIFRVEVSEVHIFIQHIHGKKFRD
jgi:hypothetical protein